MSPAKRERRMSAAHCRRILSVGRVTVVAQLKRCRDEVGAGVVDLMFQLPASADLGFLMRSLEIFGKQVLPHIRDI